MRFSKLVLFVYVAVFAHIQLLNATPTQKTDTADLDKTDLDEATPVKRPTRQADAEEQDEEAADQEDALVTNRRSNDADFGASAEEHSLEDAEADEDNYNRRRADSVADLDDSVEDHRRKKSHKSNEDSSSESHSAEDGKIKLENRVREPVAKAIDVKKAAAREQLENFVGKFVMDYLISRLKSAKKRLISTLTTNDSNED